MPIQIGLASMQLEFTALHVARARTYSRQRRRERFGGICRFEYQAERAGELRRCIAALDGVAVPSPDEAPLDLQTLECPQSTQGPALPPERERRLPDDQCPQHGVGRDL